MTDAQATDLAAAVAEYQATGDDWHLANWINHAATLRRWRANPLPADGRGVYVHLFPRDEKAGPSP